MRRRGRAERGGWLAAAAALIVVLGLGAVLLTWHNLAYYAQLMAGMRTAIAARSFAAYAAQVSADWARGDIEPWNAVDEEASA